jgi:hypothetical protein
MVKYGEYIVIADGWIKWRGSFKSCQSWCRNYSWVHDAFKELIIVKVVADGKAI